jgi:hypothetical protein
VLVSYGRSVPEGHLTAFSVDTLKEARDLIILTCPTNNLGEHVAPELAEVQNLVNLSLFGDRLARGYEILKIRKTKERNRKL